MIFHQINQLASTTRSNQHYQQPTGTNLRFWDKDWIQEMNQGLRGDGAGEDVDGDCPLPMRGALVMTMAMISPSRREVSPAEQLCRSPRLVASDFFPRRKTSYSRRWPPESQQGPTRQGARPHPRGQVVAPLTYFFCSVFFIISKNNLRGVSGLLELCRIGL